MDLALVRCLELPEPDPDEALLVEALRRSGIDAVPAAWDDPAVRWDDFHACVLRATWNYHERIDAFLAWTERVPRLFNPPAVVRANAHKSYLLTLPVPVVPTVVLPRGSTARLADVMRDWPRAVIKPAVSAASFMTRRVEADAAGERHLRALVAERDAMVQPYVASVEDYGERAIVWIDGAVTHAVRKSPRFEGDVERVSEAVAVADDERRLAEAAVPPGLLYARVDVARDEAGRPMVMELELIEPSLYLAQSPAALDRFVSAIARRLC